MAIYFVHITHVHYKEEQPAVIVGLPENSVSAFTNELGARNYVINLTEGQKQIERSGVIGETEFGKDVDNSLVFVPGWSMESEKILFGTKTTSRFNGEIVITYRFVTRKMFEE